ncbi:MAG: hypothetical protein ACKOTF_05270, partial [Opitutaceae bacterium]
ITSPRPEYSGLGDVIKVNIRTGRELVHEWQYSIARGWLADSGGHGRVGPGPVSSPARRAR